MLLQPRRFCSATITADLNDSFISLVPACLDYDNSSSPLGIRLQLILDIVTLSKRIDAGTLPSFNDFTIVHLHAALMTVPSAFGFLDTSII